ncbi:MAG TPA: YegP family protein [Saprospiraceae bacterium]|nr:YegP family protein [Saprospiraceae bacterium]
MLKGLATTIERNNINVQPFPSKSWRVHGRVFDPNDLPLKGLTVFLAGSNKQAIPGLAYACSDEQGYYAITLSEREITELKLETVYLAVSDANRKIVYFNAEPLHVLLRTIDYRDIFIEAEVCGAPPPDSIEPPVTIAHPKFVVAMDKNNQYYFHLTTTNGEILIKSKAYKDQESAVSGVQSLKQNVARERFEIQISRGKKYYFTIKSPDGIIIFTSELYDSDIVLTKVIESVISIAPGAPVELIS